MKSLLGFLSLVLAGGAFAEPSATVTGFVHNPDTGLVTIDYALTDGPAIVTADIRTNGVSVGRLVRTMMGDVNRLVTNETGRIYWIPRPATSGFSVDANGLSAVLRVRRPDDPPAYMVVRLDQEKTFRYYENEESLPHGIEADDYRYDSFLMRRIPAAGETFTMGSPRDEAGASVRCEIGHRVSFTNDYYIGVFEFTYAQALRYNSTVYANQSDPQTRKPLTNCGYEGVLRGWRNNNFKWPQNGHDVSSDTAYLIPAMRTRTGLLFDLPTESQWEFAARAGSTTALPFGLTITNTVNDATSASFAWCSSNAYAVTHYVGLKRPNAWGLYDILGNVSEMCLDVWSDDNTVYGEIDPPGFATEDRTSFVLRGGSFNSNVGYARLGSRAGRLFSGSSSSEVGFRLWCPLPVSSTLQ